MPALTQTELEKQMDGSIYHVRCLACDTWISCKDEVKLWEAFNIAHPEDCKSKIRRIGRFFPDGPNVRQESGKS